MYSITSQLLAISRCLEDAITGGLMTRQKSNIVHGIGYDDDICDEIKEIKTKLLLQLVPWQG